MKNDRLINIVLVALALAAITYFMIKRNVVKPIPDLCDTPASVKSEKDCLKCCGNKYTADQPNELQACVDQCTEDFSTTMGD